MDDPRDLYDKWRSQSRKGFLDLCVLAVLSLKKESYGLDLMTTLNDAGIDVTEGTLYPLLMRMTREGLLAATWTTPETGHPRKYYRLTPSGAPLLRDMKIEYTKNIESFETLLAGGDQS